MNNEYIIINRTAIENEITELEMEKLKNPYSAYYTQPINIQINTLKRILSQSTPLIPEIEKAYDEGVCAIQENNGKLKVKMPKAKQEYISTLKLADI